MENTRNCQLAEIKHTTDLDDRFEQARFRLPLYESPSVVSYSDEDILDELGPAQTMNYNGDTRGL